MVERILNGCFCRINHIALNMDTNYLPLPLTRNKRKENKHIVMAWYITITVEVFIASVLLAEAWLKIQ